MSTYVFTLQDYHAVKEANIRIDGLTVLAGVNGSGKSTIARWLYYIVNALNNYERSIVNEAIDEYKDLVAIINKSTQISPVTRQAWSRISRRENIPDADLDEAHNYVNFLIETFVNFLANNVSVDTYKSNYTRLHSIFDLSPIEDESLTDFIKRLSSALTFESDRIFKTAVALLKIHSITNLKRVLENHIDTSIDEVNLKVGLKEDGVELLTNNEFLLPLFLQQSIYFATQSLTESLRHYTRGGIKEYLFNKSDKTVTSSDILAKTIKRIIGGEVILPEDDLLNSNSELHFIREDGLSILLKGAATSIISFSHILRLLENGWLTKETILIIDEPEAHLHPQWIVEYARVLVLINKYIGTKVLISTHNPDMVVAIQSITERQGIGETTVFYLAKKSEDSNQYIYEDLGNDIGPIFDSFNIALDRIEQYG